MKTWHVSLVILVAAVLVVCGCVQQDRADYEIVQQNGSLNYTGFKYGISFLFSPEWVLEHGEYMNADMILLHPESGLDGEFPETVSVTIYNVPEDVSLRAFTNDSVTDVMTKFRYQKTIELTETELSGMEAHRFVYITGYDRHAKWMQIWTIKDNKAYMITYSAWEDRFDLFLGDAQQIVGSFAFA